MMAPGMQLDAGLFAGGEASAVYLIWQNLLVFANIGISVVLLVIVISQLTGYGIDNYGIKKMLPKLIITAVMINLSFVVCQIAVDLSNIIGKGLVNLFSGMVDNLHSQLATTGDRIEWTFGAIFTSLFGATAGAGAVAGTAVQVFLLYKSGPWWIIPIVLLALGALIAIFTFFLMIATRQVLAVLLVAISPLAFLCYALPNTQGLFKKWWGGFKAVLVVYPICGALFGLSKMAQLISNTADGLHIGMIVIGILMTFLPLVAAPVLVKKALSSFGAVGAMLSGIGSKARAGLKAGEVALQRTGAYQDATRRADVARLERKMKSHEAVKSGKATRMDRLRNRLSGGERGYQNSVARYNRMKAEDISMYQSAIRNEGATKEMEMEELSSLMQTAEQRDLTVAEEGRVSGLLADLSATPGGGKLIDLAMRDGNKNIRSRAVGLIGKNIVTNDNLARAIGGRSELLSSYIRDVNSGAINSRETSFHDYCANTDNDYLNYRRREALDARRSGRTATFIGQDDWMADNGENGAPKEMYSVARHVANNVLKKDKDLLAQSGSDLEKYLLPNITDQARLDGLIENNDYIFRSGEVDAETKNLIASYRSKPVNATELSRIVTELSATGGGNPAELGRLASLITTMGTSTSGREEIAKSFEQVTGAAAEMIGRMAAENSKVRDAIANSSNLAMARLSSIASGAIDSSISQDGFNNLNADYVKYATMEASAGRPVMSQLEWHADQSSPVDLANTMAYADTARQAKQSKVSSVHRMVNRNNPTDEILVNILDNGMWVNSATGEVITNRGDYGRPS